MTWSLTPICERKFCADPVRPRWTIRAPAFPMTRSRRGCSVSLRRRARSRPYGERAGDEALGIYTRRIVLVQRPSVALHGFFCVEGPMTDDRPWQDGARDACNNGWKVVCGPADPDRDALAAEYRRAHKLA